MTSLSHLLSQFNLDAVAVIPGPNLLLLTGLDFHLSERPIVAFFPVQGVPTLIVPQLEVQKAMSGAQQFQIFDYDDNSGFPPAFARALQAMQISGKKLGVEGRRMRFLELSAMYQTGLAPQCLNADAMLAELRMRKSAQAIADMRQAVHIAESALLAVLPDLRAGISEQEFASELVIATLRAGSGVLPFQPIIAAGANGAKPHANASEYRIQPGDLVTIDWGASHNHYLADLTRTYAVAGGEIHPELVRAYDAVLAANTAGRLACRPGATGQAVDRAARQAITEAGFGAYFNHRTGHGLGLEGHEEPDMKETNLLALEPGMTFTVEPGVYLPGIGGVRIEDNLVITAEGAESLSTLPRQLTVIG
ncbi:MAG TPA: aminopeptidase P family protein [Anaerolineales bacterium]|nr:aminopeptidase P family protein [Anaerolineales bacterium]